MLRSQIGRLCRRLIALSAFIGFVAGDQATYSQVQTAAAAPLAELLTLDRTHYTGGLDRGDRALAERIRVAMMGGPPKACADLDTAAWLEHTRTRNPLRSAAGIDPDLAVLVRALDHPRQQVRDVAAYTLGLLGPAARDAIPVLERKFSYQPPKTPDQKGGWFNFAYGRVACENTSAPSVGWIVPDSVLPPRDRAEGNEAKVLEFVAQLYLNPDYEYPPGMLSDPARGLSTAHAALVVRLLTKVLDRDGLSGQKYSEAAEVLTYLSGKDAPEVLPALHAFLKQTQSTDPDVRFWVGYTLVRLNRQEGIPLLLETLGINSFADWSYDWNDDLCRMGHAAISAEDKLIDLARHAKWPVVTRMTVRVLGCIGSTKAIPLLTKMLQEPDWKLNIAAARALATIGVLHNDSARGLERLASDHWSAKVRRAASEALARLNGEQRPPAPAPQTTHGIETSEVVVVGGDPLPYNHGLPWCDDSGRFSVDGRQWFRAQWIEPAIEKEPDIIPKRLLQTRGTQTFLQVDDGWLMGSRGFESQGFLVHVSLDGRVQDFAGGSALYYNASISAIVRVHGKYLAVGNESRRGTDEDLLALTRARDGTWSSERVVALPGVPNAYAISPRGDLLLRDDANRYAILGHEIVPLQCEKQRAGSYFDNHREEIETD